MNTMPKKTTKKKMGRPSQGRGGRRANINIRACVVAPYERLVSEIIQEQGRWMAKSEAFEIIIREALESRGIDYIEGE